MPSSHFRGRRVFYVMRLCVLRRTTNRGNLAFPDSSCLMKCMRPTIVKTFQRFLFNCIFFLRLFLADSSVSVVTMLLAGRSRNRGSIPRPALQSTRPQIFLFIQNFTEHCTLKQGLTYIPCQPQCSLVNTATNVTLLCTSILHKHTGTTTSTPTR